MKGKLEKDHLLREEEKKKIAASVAGGEKETGCPLMGKTNFD